MKPINKWYIFYMLIRKPSVIVGMIQGIEVLVKSNLTSRCVKSIHHKRIIKALTSLYNELGRTDAP